MFLLTSLFMLILVMVSVGFFTLLERKIMGYMHNRKGPTKVGIFGIFQPFSDGAKLFLKEQIFPMNSNFFVYYICPVFNLIQSLFIWSLFPFYMNCIDFNYGFLFFLCCSSISVYGLIICGWSSNSIYSLLGCIRSVSQAISYEVSLSLILLCYFFLCDSYSLINFNFIQNFNWFILFSFPMFFCWLSCCLAETNRTPFDFSEGESELVSGFNVEYGSGGFALLFISEYASIIFISMITCLIFLGGNFYSFSFFLKIMFICFFFVWIRCTLPRYRYDKLMYMAWKCYLPMSLNYIMMFLLIKFMVFYHFFLLSY
uniref:NADH-ubiquinone oxidoreductase chain 1 n=2 Tax=Cicadellidae TaxID=30102 RepID=A0A7T1FUH0_9HEMI|nr:NADH dehydrogenase subunit 1 [Mitjaevia protuberanta]YP_010117074.1 NADH dehydrogenase subunit 1 [Gunungidia aurantiifasciata]QJA16319.1 NADH dehydrogenase subunit 1 [Mitjaevia protuberanta]QPM99288.1 NADH dehydrogenase subunit 1 [Gunungidia aurantiifasciata]